MNIPFTPVFINGILYLPRSFLRASLASLSLPPSLNSSPSSYCFLPLPRAWRDSVGLGRPPQRAPSLEVSRNQQWLKAEEPGPALPVWEGAHLPSGLCLCLYSLS